MEFGAFLQSLQSVDDKFKTAVSANDMSKLLSVIENVSDVNMIVDKQLDRRALHLACRHGNVDMLVLLLERGADPQIGDALGFLPWHMAFNSGLQKGVRLILSSSPVCMEKSLWQYVEEGQVGHPALAAPVVHHFHVSLLKNKEFGLANSLVSTFVKAVVPGVLSATELTKCEKFLAFFSNTDVIVKLFILAGNHIPTSTRELLLSRCSEDTQKWLSGTFNKPWSLQALCRVSIRRNLRYNTFYAISALDLPDMLKTYLSFNFDDEYELNVMPHLPVWPEIWRGIRLADPQAIAYN